MLNEKVFLDWLIYQIKCCKEQQKILKKSIKIDRSKRMKISWITHLMEEETLEATLELIKDKIELKEFEKEAKKK